MFPSIKKGIRYVEIKWNKKIKYRAYKILQGSLRIRLLNVTNFDSFNELYTPLQKIGHLAFSKF